MRGAQLEGSKTLPRPAGACARFAHGDAQCERRKPRKGAEANAASYGEEHSCQMRPYRACHHIREAILGGHIGCNEMAGSAAAPGRLIVPLTRGVHAKTLE